MRRNSLQLLVLLIAIAAPMCGQVVSPLEMQDAPMRRLQQQYLEELKTIGTDITNHSFPYPFYFSRKLDIDESQQKLTDQRSIRFERYNGQVALEITGNYYASYAADRLDPDHRVRQTYTDVVLPILNSMVPKFASEAQVEAFAVEVSHHLRKKVMGVDAEYAENVVVVVPRELAAKVIGTKDLSVQQQLMLDAEVYHDSEPVILWLTGEKPVEDQTRARRKAEKSTAEAGQGRNKSSIDVPETRGPIIPISMTARVVPEELRSAPLHDSSPDALKALQQAHQSELDAIVRDLDSTAHFVSYAPPAFIPFKQGAFLQVSVTTTLDPSSSGSQYKLAALAFDRHISHLIKPTLGALSDTSKFDGLDLSTTVKVVGDKNDTYTQSIEFIFPLSALRCYEHYDCTGQQLLNAGYVLINGERVGLDLQTAESTGPSH